MPPVTAIHKGLKFLFAQLPQIMSGLRGQFVTLHRLFFVKAHDSAVEVFGYLFKGVHLQFQVGKPCFSQHVGVQPKCRLHVIITARSILFAGIAADSKTS